MRATRGIRSLEDVELAALSYAEVKALASGNPLVIEKAGVDAEVAKLSTLFSVWRNQRWANESEVGRLPMMIESLEKKVALHAQDAGSSATADDGAARRGAGWPPGRRARRRGRGPARTGEGSEGGEPPWRSRLIDRAVGRFGGFELGILTAVRGEETPALYLAGRCLYDAEPYQTGPALVAALLAALDLGWQAARRRRRAAQRAPQAAGRPAAGTGPSVRARSKADRHCWSGSANCSSSSTWTRTRRAAPASMARRPARPPEHWPHYRKVVGLFFVSR
jgi:hypothetical protein